MNQTTDSSHQLAIYETIAKTKSNVVISATAGSGKTTTILKSLSFIPRMQRTVFLSFSSAIAKELKDRVPSHIKAATLHSLGFEMIRAYFRNQRIQMVEDKYFRFAASLYKEAKQGSNKFLDKKEYRAAMLVQEVCHYARMTLTPNTTEDLKSMCVYYNIDWDEQILTYASSLLKDALKVGSKTIIIDYTDMIYFPSMMAELIHTQYDNVYLDEAQDTNRAQLQLLERIIALSGRLIAVGDKFQCIYGFSGADINVFQTIQDRPNTVVLPLSVSYRCPRVVVEKAQSVNQEIQPWDRAIEGVDREGDWSEIREQDMVLSRITRPLISLYFKLIEADIRAKIIGKDIESGLVDLAESCLSDSQEGVLFRLDNKFNELTKELMDLGIKKYTEHPRYRALEEKVKIISIVLNKVQKPKVQLVPLIKDMFNEKKPGVKLMTIHRSKGLQNPRVFLITEVNGKVLMPSPWAQQPWELVQERNLQFVAYTRSQSELISIKLTD